MCMASVLALVLSIFLWQHEVLEGSMPGCDGASECNEVMASRWAQWGPWPVAALGIGAYVSMLTLLVLVRRKRMEAYRPWLWALLCLQSIVGLGFILWLTGLQGFAIGHFCLYCLSAHACGALAFILVLRYAPVWRHWPRTGLRISGSAALPLALLIGLHIGLNPDRTVAQTVDTLDLAQTGGGAGGSGGLQIGTAVPSRTVRLLGGQLTFDLYQVPVIGDRQAEQVVVELYDYLCPSCRKVYRLLHTYQEKEEGRLAVIPLPVPMDTECNPNVKRTLPIFKNACAYTRLGLAVYLADPAVYPAFHDWMLDGALPPKLKDARARAETLVGRELLAEKLDDPQIARWIQDGINLYAYIKATTLPKIIAEDTVISSSGLSQRKLFKSLDEALHPNQEPRHD